MWQVPDVRLQDERALGVDGTSEREQRRRVTGASQKKPPYDR